MSIGMGAAVTEATRLGEIGFPEFTTKLITDTFDAIVSANIRQTQAYLELLSAVAKTLSTYIDDTKDDISGEMLLQFLAKVMPDPQDASGTKVRVNGTLTNPEANDLKNKLKVEGIPDDPKITGLTGGSISEDTFKAILDAVAKRIAADKYTLLKEMVKMGVLRLVIEHGVIETKLTFTTYGSSFYESVKTKYNTTNFSFRAKAGTGSFVSLFVSGGASTSFNYVTISTARETNRDISGSQVQIYGRVQIDFKTDYQPMAV